MIQIRRTTQHGVKGFMVYGTDDLLLQNPVFVKTLAVAVKIKMKFERGEQVTAEDLK